MKRLNSVTLSLLCLVGIKSVAQPSIFSFSPASGPVGTVVTITGNNFNNTVAGNTVYFGTAKAGILSASISSISVTVPYGASYQPITVTSSNLTAYSARPFIITFAKDTVPLDAGMFSVQADIPSGGSVNGIATGDFNGDGKPDLVTANYDSGSISVFQNTTTSNLTSFSSKVNYSCGQGASNIAIGDIDGDGKLDIAVTNYGVSTISVFRNTTTSAAITFSSKYDFPTESLPLGIAIRDIDLDGKPDMAVTCYDAKTLCLYKNVSSVGNIVFNPRKNYITE